MQVVQVRVCDQVLLKLLPSRCVRGVMLTGCGSPAVRKSLARIDRHRIGTSLQGSDCDV